MPKSCCYKSLCNTDFDYRKKRERWKLFNPVSIGEHSTRSLMFNILLLIWIIWFGTTPRFKNCAQESLSCCSSFALPAFHYAQLSLNLCFQHFNRSAIIHGAMFFGSTPKYEKCYTECVTMYMTNKPEIYVPINFTKWI